ncbi:hypothetical protein S83_065914 [Arachis hypogaea]
MAALLFHTVTPNNAFLQRMKKSPSFYPNLGYSSPFLHHKRHQILNHRHLRNLGNLQGDIVIVVPFRSFT